MMIHSHSLIAKRFNAIGKSIFSEMTEMAKAHNAINLGQGFPDFFGPIKLLEAISKQVLTCHNQYSPSHGEAALRLQVSQYVQMTTGISYHPDTEVTITTGASEALYCAIQAFVNPGDKVLVFEPAFDLYYQAIASAGGIPLPVKLHAPGTPLGDNNHWSIDWAEFDAITAQGFAIAILNTPHNPTGKVFSEEEMERIAAKALKYGAIILSDEVYENMVYDEARHVSLCSFANIHPSVVRISSAAKTFGFTGLKTGWVCAPASLTQAIRIVHQATVFCTSPFTQLGLAEVMADTEWFSCYLNEQRASYVKKRNSLKAILEEAGYFVPETQGTFFLTASYETFEDIPDVTFAKKLVEETKIAAIPLSSFYVESPKNLPWLRFAFCKTEDTLKKVAMLFKK